MIVTDEMVERAAKVVERFTTSGYGWTDEQFEIWWNRDPYFVTQIKTWSFFQGTQKARLLHETRLALEAALKD
jgi:hypothetical protein